MPQRLFFSWQSDVKQNRNFIRSALDEAVALVAKDSTIDEATREIEVDQDTQGLPGTPSVADAILNKIRSADIFVADLTYVDPNNTRRTPNPNVLLEYGYALHALGDTRIIGVFNEMHGRKDELPFDLVHKRWPISFKLPEKAEERASERRRFVGHLEAAIKSIVSQFDATKQLDQSPSQYIPIEPPDGIGRLRGFNDYLCLRPGGEAVRIPAIPYAFLRFIPSVPIRELTNAEARQIAQSDLRPITGLRSGGHSLGRHETGSVSFWTTNAEPNIALDASEIFTSGEIWGNSFYLLNTPRSKELGFNFIPTGAFEETFIDAFSNFMDIAKNKLKFTLPFEVQMGIVSVAGYKLAVDQTYFSFEDFIGPILSNNILSKAKISEWNADPFDTLEPFFSKIYDNAGETRPAVRQSGRSQR